MTHEKESPITQLLAGIALVMAFIAGIYYATSMPLVAISNSTGLCEYVEPATAGTCEHLPKKYTQIIVK